LRFSWIIEWYPNFEIFQDLVEEFRRLFTNLHNRSIYPAPTSRGLSHRYLHKCDALNIEAPSGGYIEVVAMKSLT